MLRASPTRVRAALAVPKNLPPANLTWDRPIPSLRAPPDLPGVGVSSWSRLVDRAYSLKAWGRVRDRGAINWSRTRPRVRLGANARAVRPCGGNPNQAGGRSARPAGVLAQARMSFVRNFVGLILENDRALTRFRSHGAADCRPMSQPSQGGCPSTSQHVIDARCRWGVNGRHQSSDPRPLVPPLPPR